MGRDTKCEQRNEPGGFEARCVRHGMPGVDRLDPFRGDGVALTCHDTTRQIDIGPGVFDGLRHQGGRLAGTDNDAAPTGLFGQGRRLYAHRIGTPHGRLEEIEEERPCRGSGEC